MQNSEKNHKHVEDIVTKRTTRRTRTRTRTAKTTTTITKSNNSPSSSNFQKFPLWFQKETSWWFQPN